MLGKGGVAQVDVGSNSLPPDGVNFADFGTSRPYSADDFIF